MISSHRGMISEVTSNAVAGQPRDLARDADVRHRNLGGGFAKMAASGAEVAQERTEQPYGVRDCAIRDPAGNLIRIQELR